MTLVTRAGVCLATMLFSGVMAGQTRSVYSEFGVRTIINVAGSATRVGGAQMPPEVMRAMADAALESVSMMELHAAASRHIAAATGAEAGFITAGASAGLTLGTAAILAGLDLVKMERLPDTTGMKNEFIISREHRNGYDHAIRVALAKLIEVGLNEQLAGAGVRRTEAWEYEAAITDRTAGIAYVLTGNSQPPLDQVVAVARKHGLPVLVDAAGQLPACAGSSRRALPWLPPAVAKGSRVRSPPASSADGRITSHRWRCRRSTWTSTSRSGSAGGSHPEVAPAGDSRVTASDAGSRSARKKSSAC